MCMIKINDTSENEHKQTIYSKNYFTSDLAMESSSFQSTREAVSYGRKGDITESDITEFKVVFSRWILNFSIYYIKYNINLVIYLQGSQLIEVSCLAHIKDSVIRAVWLYFYYQNLFYNYTSGIKNTINMELWNVSFVRICVFISRLQLFYFKN